MNWHTASGILARCQRKSTEQMHIDETSNFSISKLNSMSCCFDVLQSISVRQNVNETKPASANPHFGLQK